jgi:hypothetical protein
VEAVCGRVRVVWTTLSPDEPAIGPADVKHRNSKVESPIVQRETQHKLGTATTLFGKEGAGCTWDYSKHNNLNTLRF